MAKLSWLLWGGLLVVGVSFELFAAFTWRSSGALTLTDVYARLAFPLRAVALLALLVLAIHLGREL